MPAIRHKRGEVLGVWSLRRFIDSGGNGEVWQVEGPTGQPAALKILVRPDGDRYPRFKREVEILREVDPERYAVLPVLDAALPESPSREAPAWFVMPLATGVTQALSEAGVSEKVAAIREIATTLSSLLRDFELNHRDIKPANLYWFDGRYVVGDFGLAKRPLDPELTEPGKPLGPFHYLPSEVFVPGEDELDWERVDVACLAKTLWQLVAETEYAPRGPITAGGQYSLTRFSSEEYVDALDRVLAAATDDSPAQRPTLDVFADQLAGWEEGQQIRGGLVQEIERSERHQRAVLKWIVHLVRRDAKYGFRGLQYDVENVTAPSGVDDLTEGDVIEALGELSERFLIDATPYRSMGERVPHLWASIYPTYYGILEVESEGVLLGLAEPLVRSLVGIDESMFALSPRAEVARFGGVAIPPAEAYFLLTFLQGRGFVSYDERREGGGGLLIMNLKLTHSGKAWLAGVETT